MRCYVASALRSKSPPARGGATIRYDLDCIVVATDFSKTSREAVRRALDLGRRIGTSVHIVHVAQKYRPNFPWSKANREAVERMAREEREEAGRRLEALAPKKSSFEVRTRVLVATEPHVAILEYVGRVGGDLLVVGSKGHSALGEFLVGSTAERCLRAGDVPVLVVPPKAG